MDFLFQKLAESIAAQGLSMMLTCAAVWYLYGKIKECEADRKALWERLFEFMENNDQAK